MTTNQKQKPKTIPILKRLKEHIRFLRENELHAEDAYNLLSEKLIAAIIDILRTEKLVKSEDDTDLPHIQLPPKITIDVRQAISGTIDKYLEAMRYMLLGDAAGPDALEIVEQMRAKTKMPDGIVPQAYFASTDMHRDYWSDIHQRAAPAGASKFRAVTIAALKERCGENIDKSIAELRNKLMRTLDESIAAQQDEHKREAQREAMHRLQEQDLNARQRREMVREMTVQAAEQRLSLQDLKQALRDTTRDYSTNWNLIVHTETQLAANTAAVHTISEAGAVTGTDPIVAIVDKMDERETEFCSENSHHANGEWKYFRLSRLKPPGYNLGKPKKEWSNSAPLRHFGCRCILVYVPRGYKLDANGSLVKLEGSETVKIEG